jgi:hypothetical protein
MTPRLALPPGWTDRTVLTYVGPDTGSGSPSLVVSRDQLADGVSLARYAAMQDAAIRAGIEGVELVEDRETTVAGHPAIRHTYRWSYGEQSMRQRLWCLVAEGSGYAIVASAADAEFDGLRSVWASAVASFSLE